MRKQIPLAAVPFAALVLTAAACGARSSHQATQKSAPPSTRTVAVEMVDIGFKPASITVARGETVTFRFTNSGTVAHDAFIGDHQAQSDHEQDMAGDMSNMHHDSDAITVEPGKIATLTHTFGDAHPIEIGCHQPGHYAAGMRIAIAVN